MKEVIICQDLKEDLTRAIGQMAYDRLFVLADMNTACLCWPLISDWPCLSEARLIAIEAGDKHKSIETLTSVWTALQEGGATRHSLLINVGGGMVTDLGGFAASTFKRGFAYINIPTTLLSMVDASVGGKTAINFGGLKNEIGMFSLPASVLLDTRFLRTLDHPNLLSGYAEMLKHALISEEAQWAELMRFDLEQIDYEALCRMIAQSVAVKERIVKDDPTEQGIRKALNLGHTVGHAFESLALQQGRPVLHGYAVAWGIVCELFLSACLTGFPKERLMQTLQFVREHYGTFVFDCKQYDTLYRFMTHDKKNEAGRINFTLLAGIGEICINQTASKEDIEESLDFFRDSMGC